MLIVHTHVDGVVATESSRSERWRARLIKFIGNGDRDLVSMSDLLLRHLLERERGGWRPRERERVQILLDVQRERVSNLDYCPETCLRPSEEMTLWKRGGP